MSGKGGGGQEGLFSMLESLPMGLGGGMGLFKSQAPQQRNPFESMKLSQQKQSGK